MTATSGHIKSNTEDINGYRQFVINCLGSNDRRKYFSITPFGIDFNAPVNTRCLTTGSVDRGQAYNLGALNKIKIDDLDTGESAIFATSADGLDLKSFIVFRNDGTMEQNGSADFLAGFVKLKEGFDTAVSDLNDTITELNKIITAFQDWTPVAQDGGAALKTLITTASPVTVTASTASIDDAKKDNLKTE